VKRRQFVGRRLARRNEFHTRVLKNTVRVEQIKRPPQFLGLGRMLAPAPVFQVFVRVDENDGKHEDRMLANELDSEFVKIPFSNKLFHENLWYTSPARRSNHAPAEKKHRDQV
jgi:hypothetical protein